MDKKKQTKGLTRRDFLKTTAVGGALTAAGVLGFPYVSRAANKKIKIGLVQSYSGAYSAYSKRVENGVRYAFELSKWKDQVEYFAEDDQMKPDVAVEKTQKLAEKVGVDILVGPESGASSAAISEYCKSKKRLLLQGYGGNVKLVGSNCSRYTFLCTHTTYSISAPGVPWCMDNLGKEIFLGADYSTGRDICGWFKDYYLKKGGKVVGEVYTPLGATEFAPYLTQIMNASPKPKVVGGFLAVQDLINFVKQYDEFGLKKQGIPMFWTMGALNEVVCKAMGDAALGNYDVNHWAPGLDHKENVEFKAGIEKFANESANESLLLGFEQGTTITYALDQTGGDTDNEKLVDAIEKRKWVGPRGECSFGPNHAVIHPTYVRKMENVGGICMPVVLVKLGPQTTPGGPDGPGGECKM